MRDTINCARFALVIIKNSQGKYLVVQETKGRGWWIPGGGVYNSQTFKQGAIRQCKQQAGIDIVIDQLLSLQSYNYKTHLWQRAVFFGRPMEQGQKPKNYEDQHSLKAEWVSLQQFRSKQKIRGPQLFQFTKVYQEGKGIDHKLLQQF